MLFRRLILCALLVCLLTGTVSASVAEAELTEGIDPESGLPTDVLDELGSYTEVSADSFSSSVFRVLQLALSRLGGTVSQGVTSCTMMLAAVLLCGLLESSEHTNRVSSVVGALAVTAACTGSLSSMLLLGTQTVETVDKYYSLLLPGLAALSVSSGTAAAASLLSVGTVFFMKLLMSAIRIVLVPGISLLTVLATAEAALENEKLQKLREFVRWALGGILKITLYVFTGYLAVTGVIGGTADAVRLKAAKLALSGTVPVVGGILSDASDAVLSSAAAVKSSVGIYGLLAVLALCLYPFLQVAVQHFLLKLTTALSGLIGKKCLVSQIEHLADAMGLTVGIVGAYSLMIFLSVTLFLKLSV